MSQLDDTFADVAVPLLQEHLGDAATYRAPGGTETPCTVLFEAGDDRREETEQGTSWVRSREVTLFASDVATVSKRGTVTIDGERWVINEILSQDAVQATVRLVRNESREVAREGFRGT